MTRGTTTELADARAASALALEEAIAALGSAYDAHRQHTARWRCESTGSSNGISTRQSPSTA